MDSSETHRPFSGPEVVQFDIFFPYDLCLVKEYGSHLLVEFLALAFLFSHLFFLSSLLLSFLSSD